VIDASEAAVTVTVTLPTMSRLEELYVAVTVAVPALAAVATPELVTESTAGLFEVQFTVSAPLLPSEYAPVAASCIEAPMEAAANLPA